VRYLPGDAVDVVATLVLSGLNLDALLLGRREVAPHALGLSGDRLPDAGQSDALSPSNHSQDLRAFALGARRTGFFLTSRLGGFLRALLLAASLLRGSLVRRNCPVRQ
jgi:hypothetical protein